jgi:hypothetical protein
MQIWLHTPNAVIRQKTQVLMMVIPVQMIIAATMAVLPPPVLMQLHIMTGMFPITMPPALETAVKIPTTVMTVIPAPGIFAATALMHPNLNVQEMQTGSVFQLSKMSPDAVIPLRPTLQTTVTMRMPVQIISAVTLQLLRRLSAETPVLVQKSITVQMLNLLQHFPPDAATPLPGEMPTVMTAMPAQLIHVTL